MWIKHNGVWFSKPNVLQHNVVAVYGTLKKGGGNHRLLYGQRFVNKGTTKDRYPLVISGLPYLLDKRGSGHHVEVEVYKVNNDTFSALDSLEGHPNFYRRRQLPIKLNNGTIVNAWIYFINNNWNRYDSISSTNMKYHKSFPITPKFSFGTRRYSYADKPTYEQYTYEPTTRYHERRDLFSSLSTIADKEDDNTKYCNICFEEVYYDETEISNQKYHCSVCNEMYSEQEVTS